MADQALFGLWKDVQKHTLIAPHLLQVLRPWEILDGLGTIIACLGASLPADEYEQSGRDVWIARTARVSPAAHLTGPCIIGHDTELRPGAFIRGGVLVGDEAVIGNSTELKNCVLFDGVQVPHFNYVGDSILGHRAHLGAGAVTSNVKSDRTEVFAHLGGQAVATGRRKLGAMVGDFVEIGCHTVLNPGVVIGRESAVYPGLSLRGYVAGGCVYKGEGNVVRKSH